MSRQFTRYAWFVLAFNIAVILWGAYVRATGSGAGCGEHWPLCNGVVLPRSPQAATIIEFTHRITSGLALVFVIALVIAAFRTFPSGHIVRRTASLSILLTLTEALIGAALVLLGHVAANTSEWRGVSLSVHLVNTMLLLAAIALTAWWSRAPQVMVQRTLRPALAIAGTVVLLVGVTGAIAALGDTLFAAKSISEGLRNDMAPSAHLFVRLRVLHPPLAAGVAIYLLAIALFAIKSPSATKTLKRLSTLLAAFVLLQVTIGVVNLALLAPVPVQMIHLLIADLLWITFVLYAAESVTAVAEDVVRPPSMHTVPAVNQ
jgi:heme A synthase